MVTHQLLYSWSCNKDVCRSQGSQEPRDLKDSSPQPGAAASRHTYRSKTCRAHQSTQGRVEKAAETRNTDKDHPSGGGSLPRYSLRHCLYLDTRKSHQPRAGAKIISTSPLPSTSAKTWEARNCSRSSHIPSPVHHKGSRNSVSMYFNGFVANIIFAVK